MRSPRGALVIGKKEGKSGTVEECSVLAFFLRLFMTGRNFLFSPMPCLVPFRIFFFPFFFFWAGAIRFDPANYELCQLSHEIDGLGGKVNPGLA